MKTRGLNAVFPPQRRVWRSGPCHGRCDWRFLATGVGRSVLWAEHSPPERPAREAAPEPERVHLIPALSVPGAAAFLHSHCPFLLWDHRAPGLSPCAGRVTPACGFRPDLICQCAWGKGVGGQMERSAAKGSADCGVRCLKQACPPSVGKARPVAHCPSWPGPRGAAWTGIG